ncbi:hypothetical protein UFOVP742_10 [uncultured Caudovirales phage]|uniref:Uncharacterized protein n=1 Tax=uncultured Caudovirales phage TaxID=2100421 RepID=A0A6J7X284_9CAUD|nr:hypothetical protein UFOVP742_10 [uncultured Caudovirales phage]
MTENQKQAFGFAGKSLLWSEIINHLNEVQTALTLQAIAQSSKGEDRTHLCGQADAVNYVISSLINFRQEARQLNGLTPTEDLA